MNGAKVANDWADPAVGGLILVGLAFGALFVWIESRVPEPIVPLGLFRIRTFTISVAAMFLAAFGFFTAVIFLPRWFQTVAGASATESGYNILPLLAGLIFSAIASGQIVARTGRYKVLIFGSLVLLGFGLFLLDEPPDRYQPADAVALDGPRRSRDRAVVRRVHADRPERGLARPDRRGDEQPDLLPADRRNGGSHARRHGLRRPIDRRDPDPARERRRPPADGGPVRRRRGAGLDITGTGDLGARILASLSPDLKPIVEPLIPNIVQGIHEAFSIALASTFWVGIVGALIAAAFVLFLREEPMRQTFEFGAAAPGESAA